MPIFEGEPWHRRWFEAAVRAEIATLTAGDSVAPISAVAAEQGVPVPDQGPGVRNKSRDDTSI